MWQVLLFAAVGTGAGYLAGFMKKKKNREEEEAGPSPLPSNAPLNSDAKEATNVAEQYQQNPGGLWLSYGVGIGVIFMISAGKREIDKLSSLLNQTVGLVQELKKQLDASEGCLQNVEMHKGGCNREIPEVQEEKLRKDAIYCENKGANFVGTPFEENASNRSVITDDSMRQFTGMAELEEDFQAELEDMEVHFLNPNSSNHRRSISDLSELSVAVVEGGFSANGLPGHSSSSGNKTPMHELEISHVDENGVSPYELDRHLRDLLEKQQEEKISELEMQLKSMETMLSAKERELKQWKDRVRYLAENSVGSTSGEDSPTIERTSNTDGRRQYVMLAVSNSSAKSISNSAQEGNSQFPLWSHIHCVEGPSESTADSSEKLDYRGKIASSCARLTDLAYVEGMEPTRSLSNSRYITERSCIDFLNAIADDGSSTCHYQCDNIFRQNTNQRLGETSDRASETSSCCIMHDT